MRCTGGVVGHSVFLLPVPEAEHLAAPYVADEYRRVDGGTHAHVTVLGPFLEKSQVRHERDRLMAAAQSVGVIDLVFTDVAVFPGGIVHLRPADDGALAELLERLRARYPTVLPYGGAFGDRSVFHLTIRAASSSEEIELAASEARKSLPVRSAVTEAQVVWYEPNATRALCRLPLGG